MWQKILEQISNFRKTWLFTHLTFVVVYGFALDFIAAVLFGFSFGPLEILAFGEAYYFFRLELFYWLQGVLRSINH